MLAIIKVVGIGTYINTCAAVIKYARSF